MLQLSCNRRRSERTMLMLSGKTVVVGVTGGIAAYKTVTLVGELKKQGADVHVVMTENATKFVTPLTFEVRSGNRCISDMWDRNFDYDVKHISLAKAADLIIVAPATANFIAKAANGIADDMLTTVILAAKCPKLVAPAMNTAMYDNPATQDNIKKITEYGFKLIEPAEGLLACGDEGKGKMPEPEELLQHVLSEIACEKDMQGLSVLVTAGPTQEAIDPVRYITNHSSGKMGYAIAQAAALRGADVTLVSGRTNLSCPLGVKRIDVTSAEDMYKAVTKAAPKSDIVIKAAAVADFTPKTTAYQKIKKDSKSKDMSIEFKPTHDRLKEVGQKKKKGQIICGFAMETEELLANAKKKLESKNLDMICANSLRTKGAGFQGDTNVVTMITKDSTTELGQLSKTDTAQRILDALMLMK